MYKLISFLTLNLALASTAQAACANYFDADLRLLHSDKTANICEDFSK